VKRKSFGEDRQRKRVLNEKGSKPHSTKDFEKNPPIKWVNKMRFNVSVGQG